MVANNSAPPECASISLHTLVSVVPVSDDHSPMATGLLHCGGQTACLSPGRFSATKFRHARKRTLAIPQLAGLLEQVPGSLSYEEFMTLADDAFEHSKTRTCRFIVRASDRATTKEGFQRGLKTIQERFYYWAENF